MMETETAKTEGGKDYNRFGEQIIPCTICNGKTTMLGTKLCDSCWELDGRIRDNLDIAERLVNYYRGQQG